MKKPIILLMIFFSTISFAQEKEKKTKKDNTSTLNTSNSKDVQSAIPINKESKNSPEVFYIVNDRPVDLETYQKHQKATAKNKK